jgi:glycosyltransferase involved in cell wall biosynthesis
MQQLYALEDVPQIAANGIDFSAYLPANPDGVANAPGPVPDLPGAAAPDRALALFVGSNHGPNIEAAARIVEVARERPGCDFLLAGSVCHAEAAFCEGARPGNVHLLGVVSEAELRQWLQRASVGLNPMLSGSGTNLKILQYAAAGLPILSTPFGARGGLLEAGTHLRVAEIDGFASALDDILRDREKALRMAAAARDCARAQGDWGRIAEGLWPFLTEVLEAPPDRDAAATAHWREQALTDPL